MKLLMHLICAYITYHPPFLFVHGLEKCFSRKKNGSWNVAAPASCSYLCGQMKNKYEFTDQELGTVLVRTNVRACHIILRPQPCGITVTVPPYTSLTEIRNVLERFRDSLKKGKEKMKRQRIDLNFRIDAPFFRFSLSAGTKENFYIHRCAERTELVCPAHVSFEDDRLQEWLRKVIKEELRLQAKQILPLRLQTLSVRYGLTYTKVNISTSKGRWGSCSGNRHISLSCFLLLLPVSLIDYVLLHELSHTVEMNHGAGFWALMDRLTDGQARALRNELRKVSPYI